MKPKELYILITRGCLHNQEATVYLTLRGNVAQCLLRNPQY